MNILRRAKGITILDDTYNANPQSMRAAVSVLADGRPEEDRRAGGYAGAGPLLARPPL